MKGTSDQPKQLAICFTCDESGHVCSKRASVVLSRKTWYTLG